MASASATEKLWLKDVTKAGEYIGELDNIRKQMIAIAENAEVQNAPQIVNITTEAASIIDQLSKGIMETAKKQVAEMERQVNEAKVQLEKMYKQ